MLFQPHSLSGTQAGAICKADGGLVSRQAVGGTFKEKQFLSHFKKSLYLIFLFKYFSFKTVSYIAQASLKFLMSSRRPISAPSPMCWNCRCSSPCWHQPLFRKECLISQRSLPMVSGSHCRSPTAIYKTRVTPFIVCSYSRLFYLSQLGCSILTFLGNDRRNTL